jgi:hypothetical protein
MQAASTRVLLYGPYSPSLCLESLSGGKSYGQKQPLSHLNVTNDMPKLTTFAIIYNIQCLYARDGSGAAQILEGRSL